MSNRKTTAAQLRAKAEAYLEAADHLDQSWTDDPLEWAQGQIVQYELRVKAIKLEARAEKMETGEVASREKNSIVASPELRRALKTILKDE